MTLKRLLDEPEGDFATALLRSAELDVPGRAQVRRGVLAITAAGSALASSGAAAAASSAAASVAVAPAGAATALGALGLAKWVGVGLAVGFATAGTGAYVTTDSAGAREERATTPAIVSAVGTAPRANADRPAHAEHRGSGADVTANVAPESPARSSSNLLQPRAHRRDAPETPRTTAQFTPGSVTSFPDTPSSERASAAAMSAELAALARARTALSARAPAVVLAELESYRQLAHTHVLDAEAFMLRIEALVQLGRAVEAATLAKRYLAAHPSSPHRVRLEQVAKLDDR